MEEILSQDNLVAENIINIYNRMINGKNFNN